MLFCFCLLCSFFITIFVQPNLPPELQEHLKTGKILKIVKGSSVNLDSTTRVSVAYLQKNTTKSRGGGGITFITYIYYLNEHGNPKTKQYFWSETLRQYMIRDKEITVFFANKYHKINTKPSCKGPVNNNWKVILEPYYRVSEQAGHKQLNCTWTCSSSSSSTSTLLRLKDHHLEKKLPDVSVNHGRSSRLRWWAV